MLLLLAGMAGMEGGQGFSNSGPNHRFTSLRKKNYLVIKYKYENKTMHSLVKDGHVCILI